MKIVLGSRESELALIQTNHVKKLLEQSFPNHEISILSMTTTGDQILDKPLAQIGQKALFTKELEVELAQGNCHLIVHSLKDLPTDLPPGMCIGAITKREDPRDCIVMHPKYSKYSLADLPAGSVIGTSSVRRRAQLSIKFPQLEFKDIRGNLNTRLRKLDSGDYDAIVLAVAGITRIGWTERISSILEAEDCLHAVGQGALGLECMENNEEIKEILKALEDHDTTLCCLAERAFMRALEGGCSIPLGVTTKISENELELIGNVTYNSIQIIGKDKVSINTDNPIEQAIILGKSVAEQLLAKGAKDILATIRK